MADRVIRSCNGSSKTTATIRSTGSAASAIRAGSNATTATTRGNRWVTGTGGIGTSGLTPVANIYNHANQINGASYDGAGNLRSYGTKTLSYDAENRQTAVTESPSAGGGQASYVYDGEGRRVMRTIGNDITVFVYDVFGNLASEYNNYATEPSPCATCYLSTDHLGSTRLVTDASANIIARHDYLPFGEEVRAGEAGRHSEWGMTGDVRQKFTGQLRDNETGLDFFNARYLSADQGRFLSPDPENAGASLEDPQSWNAYAYVNNNPLNATDPSGMFIAPVPKHPSPPPGSGPGLIFRSFTIFYSVADLRVEVDRASRHRCRNDQLQRECLHLVAEVQPA